jgi:hypothetical protein
MILWYVTFGNPDAEEAIGTCLGIRAPPHYPS